jgi:hypothetical protein
MSAPVIGGLVLAGLATAMLGATAVSSARDRPSARARASRLAESLGQPLPPDLVPWLAGRLRRRQQTRLLVLGPVLPPVAFWVGYAWLRALARSLSYPQPAAALIWIIVPIPAVAAVVAHYRELGWARSHGLRMLAGDPDRRLPALVPPVRTWLVRIMVAVAAAAAVAAGVVGPPVSPRRVGLAVAGAAVSLAALVVAEIVQVRIIRGPRVGPDAAALAFDEALRRQTVADIAPAPLAVAALTAVFLAFDEIPMTSPLAPAVQPALLVVILIFYLVMFATSWSRRPGQQPSPEPAGMDELSGQTGYGYTWW